MLRITVQLYDFWTKFIVNWRTLTNNYTNKTFDEMKITQVRFNVNFNIKNHHGLCKW